MVTVGCAIPSIPVRREMLHRAFTSVMNQTRPIEALNICFDYDHEGAPNTRNRAWRGLSVDYVAFLDDDDEWETFHVEHLLACALETDADMVFPGYHVIGGSDPFAEQFGQPWDPGHPRETTVTCLWKREALEAIGGFPNIWPGSEITAAESSIGEDGLAVKELNRQGGKIVHLAERTFRWNWHGSNSSGSGARW